jgi:hypothetical protein
MFDRACSVWFPRFIHNDITTFDVIVFVVDLHLCTGVRKNAWMNDWLNEWMNEVLYSQIVNHNDQGKEPLKPNPLI